MVSTVPKEVTVWHSCSAWFMVNKSSGGASTTRAKRVRSDDASTTRAIIRQCGHPWAWCCRWTHQKMLKTMRMMRGVSWLDTRLRGGNVRHSDYISAFGSIRADTSGWIPAAVGSICRSKTRHVRHTTHRTTTFTRTTQHVHTELLPLQAQHNTYTHRLW